MAGAAAAAVSAAVRVPPRTLKRFVDGLTASLPAHSGRLVRAPRSLRQRGRALEMLGLLSRSRLLLRLLLVDVGERGLVVVAGYHRGSRSLHTRGRSSKPFNVVAPQFQFPPGEAVLAQRDQ
eukprot:COSAG04_NODE_657_length_11477_cov_17.225962_17_plen_122_part_00